MLNEKGLFTFDIIDEKGRVLIDGIDEKGYTIFNTKKYYLQFSGDAIQNGLKTPMVTFDEVIIDFRPRPQATNEYYFDFRTGAANTYLYKASTSGADFASSSSVFASGMYYNDVIFKAGGQSGSVIQYDTRGILRLVANGTYTDDCVIFSSNTNPAHAPSNMAGDLFDIKFLLGGVIQAHYDLTTGTANDQSGNGLHATIMNGIWVEDSGTAPVGVDIVYDYLLKQTIFNNISNDYSMKGSIYKDTLNNLSLNQILFRDIDNKYIMNNKIFSDMETSVSIFNRIFRESSQNFSMTQSFFNDEFLIYNSAMKIIIYNNIVKDFNTKQRSYKDSQINPALLQKIYSPKTNDFNIKNIIYKDTINSYNFNNRLYINNSNNFNVNNKIYVPYSKDSLIKNIIFKDAITNLTIVNRLYSNKQNNYYMLNRFYIENVSLATFRNIIFKNIVEDIPMQIILIAQGNYYEIIYFKANLDTSPIAFKAILPIDIAQFKAGLGENKLTFNDIIRMIYNFKSNL